MISHTTIQVIGLVLTVYGLEEYKALCSDTPVSILFALHGRLGNQSKMKPLSEALCSINPNKNRHLIVITFDSPNHGSRLINETANYAWKGERIENPNHAVDMWSMVYSTANTVSELIDVIEHYLFGPHNKSRVEIWGVAGFSMGGHAAYIAGANGNYKQIFSLSLSLSL
ncbi:hypothetical protein BDB01DRAFT_723158 [Pilobolus umbonatus]|nr:hypothetical protein BDB01DRAFT_723158 [Pilobolus umbonatus]